MSNRRAGFSAVGRRTHLAAEMDRFAPGEPARHQLLAAGHRLGFYDFREITGKPLRPLVAQAVAALTVAL